MLHFHQFKLWVTFHVKDSERNTPASSALAQKPWCAYQNCVTYVIKEKGVEQYGEQRYVLVEPWCKHWSYCDWQKGMYWDEAMLVSKEIKPVVIAITRLCLSEGIIQPAENWCHSPHWSPASMYCSGSNSLQVPHTTIDYGGGLVSVKGLDYYWG